MGKLAPHYRWQHVLFSAGKGFVKPGERRVYEAAGAHIYATSDVGTITVRFGETLSVETYRETDSR